MICISGVLGNASNQLNFAYGIARDENTGTLYVADTNNHRVMSYPPTNSFGTLVAGGTGNGVNTSQLNAPISVTFDRLSNSLLIANFRSHNVVRWALGANVWTSVAGDAQGISGNDSNLFNGPMDLTLDPMGNLYVADRRNHRIQLFLTGQSSGVTIAGVVNDAGNASNLLNQPYSLTLDNQLNLYVADSLNHRIQKFLRY